MSSGAVWAVLVWAGAFLLFVAVLNLDKIAGGVRSLWARMRGRHFINEMRKYL
jgi:hypothetical protein